MSDPATLSATFLDAFNRRDLDLLEAMVAPSVDYLRSLGEPLTTPAQVRARYAEDFELMPDSRAEVTAVIAQNETDVAFEILFHVVGRTVTGGVHHRWVDGKMTRYRAWTDPIR